ncbi:MAG: FAD-dependent oxidoreductase [Myxococcota bacterium]
MRVGIVGAGIAGTAAAWAASRCGARIHLFDHGLGATSLSSGAVDDRPWEQVARSIEVLGAAITAGELPPELVAFLDELSVWEVPAAGAPLCRLATQAGRLRVARGRDHGVLDLSLLERGSLVVLPRAIRPEWDADALARMLGADSYARSEGLHFTAVDAELLIRQGENRVGALDFAMRHDEPERRRWLVARLREALARVDGEVAAVLVGPWLGATRSWADEISTALELPIGEVLPTLGGAAGLRFEAARSDLLEALGVEVDRRRISRVDAEATVVTTEGEAVALDRVVVAIGGMPSGGVVFDPPERTAGSDYAEKGRHAFRLGLELENAELVAAGHRLDVASSMHGPNLDEVAWPTDADPGWLEAVGLDEKALDPPVFAAGDVIADHPRTLLQAAYLGLKAGYAACS